MSFLVGMLVLGGIVAKGLGVIAIIFGLGLIVGVIVTLTATRRFRR